MTDKDAKRINKLLRRVLARLCPPECQTVSEWAAKYRRLSSEASAEPGSWRNERTPYLVAVMDAFTDPDVRHIVFVAASQVGKTETELNIIGYIIDQDPGSILYVHPTTVDAKEFSRLRIAPMIRDSPALRSKVSAPKSRDSGNTITQKAFPGGVITLCGSGEAHSLASKPIRYVIGDERDRWSQSAGDEGDPWELAMARQKNFYNAKAVEVSTPTIRGESAIAAAYSKGTMERWCSECPHCGSYREIEWRDIRFTAEEKRVSGERFVEVHDIYWVCPACGCVSDEYTMKRQPAKWIAENPDAAKQGTRSFWLNAFVSPWSSWESIILKHQNAIGNSRKMQVVYNTEFGMLWEDRGNTQDPDSLLARREDYGSRLDGSPVEVPDGVLVLTAGIDTQDNRMEYEIVGHGHFGETWGIEKGVIMGSPADVTTWEALDAGVFDRVFKYRDGIGIKVSMSFVDEGGHFTGAVRNQCMLREGKHVFCVKGIGGADKPFTKPPQQVKVILDGKYYGRCWQYILGVDEGKQMIMDNLRVQTAGAKYCHFPRREDYGENYFNGLLSEHLVPEGKTRTRWIWVKIPGHERNEPLDCRNYALAARKVLPADLDAIDARLKKARGIKVGKEPSQAGETKPKQRRYGQFKPRGIE